MNSRLTDYFFPAAVRILRVFCRHAYMESKSVTSDLGTIVMTETLRCENCGHERSV